MSKTLSLIIRIVAVLGALGAGVAYYLISEENLKVAMERTDWMPNDKIVAGDHKASTDSDIKAGAELLEKNNIPELANWKLGDPELQDGVNFVHRMNAMPNVQAIFKNLREEVTRLLGVVAARNETIAERNTSIAQLKDEITKLEADKAGLTREKDDLTGKLSAANNRISGLENDKTSLQAENTRLGEEMKDETKYMPRPAFDTEVKARQAAEDKVGNLARFYTNFWNWGVKTTGVKPPQPYTRIPLIPDGTTPVQVTPQPKDAVPRIPTKIVTVDLRKGVLAVSIGRTTSGIRPGSFYDIEIAGSVVGKIRLEEVDSSISTATILPGSTISQFVQNAIINLVPVQTGAAVETPKPAPTPTPASAPAPATDLGIPPAV